MEAQEQRTEVIDEETAEESHHKQEEVAKKPNGGLPKAPFLKNMAEMAELTEEENQKFRYSKMDEKQAEILYQERY